MKDISSLSVDMSNFSKRFCENIAKEQREVAIQTHKDIQDGASVETGKYKASIILENTVVEDNRIYTAISSDLKVGGSDPKWQDYRLAIFIEHGTGPMGESTYTGRHLPVYTKHPWWYFSAKYGCFIFTEGMKATMHWQKGLDKNTPNYLKAITKALKEAKK